MIEEDVMRKLRTCPISKAVSICCALTLGAINMETFGTTLAFCLGSQSSIFPIL